MPDTSEILEPAALAPRPGSSATPEVGSDGPVRVLLVEDDPGDALLVEELLSETDLDVELVRALSVADALPRLAAVDCVLLDLNLPDSFGLDGLQTVLAADGEVAVIVLTGLADRSRGAMAVASGAQDYLIKAEVDASLLGRSVRYAIERRRADIATRRLFEVNLRRQANERIQRGLLPRPLLRSDDLEVATVYRPGGGGDVLGGDFYDAVELADGTLRAVIGDVSGHGPDEAALGVCLRIAWRTLVVAGTVHDVVLPALDDVLVAERQHEETFVTVCDITIPPHRRGATVRLAGHPPPLLLRPEPAPWPGVVPGPPLGVLPGQTWPAVAAGLPSPWAVLLYTDGLIEGRRRAGGERLGVDGLTARLRSAGLASETPGGAGNAPPTGAAGAAKGRWEAGLETMLAWVEAEHGGPLADDVAVMLLASAGAGAGAAE
ncbi:MAG TPA: SpoIIE family protein phosphatase [Acidimicrobiia bacterium]|nr:SpoIIE family protein phosphatase [Acidimicrobiia bacterium]